MTNYRILLDFTTITQTGVFMSTAL